MRCKCCNAELTSISLNPFNRPQFEDMCSMCRIASRSVYRYSEDHEFMFEDLKEGPTEIKNMDDY